MELPEQVAQLNRRVPELYISLTTWRWKMKLLESRVKDKLGVDQLEKFGCGGGGDICHGQGYRTEKGDEIYIKVTSADGVIINYLMS